jgi:hypothetical protein
MIQVSISVIPAEAGIQGNFKILDSCFHRNDKPHSTCWVNVSDGL